MASLSSKLFQVSPNRAHWLSAFRGSLPTFLTSQIQSNPPPPLESTPTSTKDIIALFTSLQTQLFEAVAQLQEILDLQDAKQKFAREIRGKDASLLSFANKLKEAEQVLDMLVDDYSDYRKPKRLKPEEEGMEDDDSSSTTTVASQLKLSDILSYAHRISYTTFAPPEFGAGQAPLRGALPPAPQDEQMRASQLYAFADLDIGLPKEVETKEEKSVDPFTSLDADALAKLKALIPSGWKPGMPVQLENLPKDLLADLPKAQESLPPFPQESLPLPDTCRVADARSNKTQEILVQHVILDIDDESESDYTSDEESDDED